MDSAVHDTECEMRGAYCTDLEGSPPGSCIAVITLSLAYVACVPTHVL